LPLSLVFAVSFYLFFLLLSSSLFFLTSFTLFLSFFLAFHVLVQCRRWSKVGLGATENSRA
jgi:hypothetical protein